jgi:hypothetical protein
LSLWIFFFNSSRVWTQGLMLARQVLYLLSHAHRHDPAYLVYLLRWVWLSFCLGCPWATISWSLSPE